MLKQAVTFAQDLLPPTFHFGIKSSQLDLLSFYLKGNFCHLTLQVLEQCFSNKYCDIIVQSYWKPRKMKTSSSFLSVGDAVSSTASNRGNWRQDKYAAANFKIAESPLLVDFCALLEFASHPALSVAHSSQGPVVLWVRRFIHCGREVEN